MGEERALAVSGFLSLKETGRFEAKQGVLTSINGMDLRKGRGIDVFFSTYFYTLKYFIFKIFD